MKKCILLIIFIVCLRGVYAQTDQFIFDPQDISDPMGIIQKLMNAQRNDVKPRGVNEYSEKEDSERVWVGYARYGELDGGNGDFYTVQQSRRRGGFNVPRGWAIITTYSFNLDSRSNELFSAFASALGHVVFISSDGLYSSAWIEKSEHKKDRSFIEYRIIAASGTYGNNNPQFHERWEIWIINDWGQFTLGISLPSYIEAHRYR